MANRHIPQHLLSPNSFYYFYQHPPILTLAKMKQKLNYFNNFWIQLEQFNTAKSTSFSCVHHFKESTYLVQDSSCFYVAKTDVNPQRASDIESCLKFIGKDSTLSQLAPRLIDKFNFYNAGSLLLFSYLPGAPLLHNQTSDVLDHLYSLSLNIENIDLNSPHEISNIVRRSLSTILSMTLSDPLLKLFSDRLSNGPPDQTVCCVHRDFTWQNFIIGSDSSLSTLKIIDWEQSGLGYKGLDFGWLLSSGHHTGLLNFSDFPSLNKNLEFFIIFGYLTMIYRLRKVRHKTELHIMHEVKCLTDLRDFLNFFELPESRLHFF